MNITDQLLNANDFDALKISIASPEKIRSWSFGEVLKPETVNYKTLKPERDGLFCAKIFGPIKDYECLCGKYKRIKYKGMVCERCGVEVTSSRVRRERMGHIELAMPVSHIWFLKSLPSRISIILDIMPKYVEKVIYFELYVVTDGKMTALENGQILSEEEYQKYKAEFGDDSFDAGMGAEAIRKLLEKLDLPKLRDNLRKELANCKSELKKIKIIKRLEVADHFVKSGNKPEWMIMTVLPVIPPDLRPLVQLDGGNFASADLNELYRRVINRNNRLKKLLELNAPEIIIRNEKRMLQESVDSLLDNTRSANPVKSANKRILKSLSDNLKGKQGRFRQNLLGKRVDYSGRSVIVVGPGLKLNQCGLPKKMALELFKPFIYAKLEARGVSSGIKHSKKMVEAETPEVWDALDDVIREHPVLLNRAPTLHRLSIQAFDPILIEGKAIQLHPLVCRAFNADFDGDQMAVHIPLSVEAQTEARVLMMSTNNVLNPRDGKPIITPSQDMIFGLYYLSIVDERLDFKNPKVIISGPAELEHALFIKRITVHDPILFKYEYRNSDGEITRGKVVTTAGREKIFNLLPDKCKEKYGFSLVNKVMDKKAIDNLINIIFEETDQVRTAEFCDEIMRLGFKESTFSGISLGKDDMVIPEEKTTVIDSSKKEVEAIENQYQDGIITAGERYNKIIDIWNGCSNNIIKTIMKKFFEEKDVDSMNPVYMMAKSGARGNESSIQQMCGIRGLLAKTTGEIIETPLLSNYKDGLPILEYFISTYKGRKSTVDTALKTSNAGYLTRRLVDVAHDCLVVDEDCGATKGLTMRARIENGKVKASLKSKIVGRVSLNDIRKHNGEIIVKSGDMISEQDANLIEKEEIREVVVRSALTCEHKHGVCAKCYGRDLTSKRLISVGEAVGVMAAQAIGETGTQLTMNTRHLGGAVVSANESNIVSPCDGKLRANNLVFVVDRNGDKIVINKNTEFILEDKKGNALTKYKIPYGSKINHGNGDSVKQGDFLAEWDPYNYVIFAACGGIAEYADIVENVSMKEKIDESTGMSSKIIIDWRRFGGGKQSLKPSILIKNGDEILRKEELFIGTIINISNRQEVKAGDIICRTPKDSVKTKDITGGLPRVAELFEARRPKNYAIMSAVDGVVTFGERDYKTKKVITIVPDNKNESEINYVVPKGKHLFVNDGDRVKRGDVIMDGDKVPHDILKILGIDEFTKYIVDEIQKVYEMQGIDINDKHIEIILSMMLKKVEITDSGETSLTIGDTVDEDEFEKINREAAAGGLAPAKAERVLLGITRASLQNKSFISAASFQETVKILTNSSIQGKVDNLEGLKENVIVGKLINAGTGFVVKKIKKEMEEKKLDAASLE
ncbi:MAG: DNA-directed RNA polymerase subunit beta' [Rickettsiales bacterium]|nr:DNA-directed RNA polymerase subunit beta' [Rickettsiales bacterium]